MVSVKGEDTVTKVMDMVPGIIDKIATLTGKKDKNEEEEITDNEILEQMKKEKSREDKLLCLLDEVQSILELNGYNLSLVYPTTD